MKTKQRNLRVFEIECSDELAVEKYIEKNKALLDGLLVLLSGPRANESVLACKIAGLAYAIVGESSAPVSASKKISKQKDEAKDLFGASEESSIGSDVVVNERVVEKIVEKIVVQTVYVEKESNDVVATTEQRVEKIIKNSTVRSGEDIVTTGDVSVFARVNSGAKIYADGCVEIFDTIDGLVECNGAYMLIKRIGKGTVVFNGNKLEPLAFDGKIKKVVVADGKLEIKDV